MKKRINEESKTKLKRCEEERMIYKLIKEENLSYDEVNSIIKSVKNEAPKQRVAFDDYFTDRVKIGVFSDAHIGHKEFDEPLFKHMADKMKKEKVSRIYNCGDTLEGMSGRDGQIYEMNKIGFKNQMDYTEELFKKYLNFCPIYGINGNHDEWYRNKRNMGMDVGEEIAKRVDNYTHLGTYEGNVNMRDGLILKLFHPNDGTAYATSYKLQKLIESLAGGEKPNILVEGHYHKALYMFKRNVHALEAGTLCGQTQWMRGKKIEAEKGFWILDIEFGKGGIGKLGQNFYPGYK